jgi:hypothetical protein
MFKVNGFLIDNNFKKINSNFSQGDINWINEEHDLKVNLCKKNDNPILSLYQNDVFIAEYYLSNNKNCQKYKDFKSDLKLIMYKW